MWIKICLTSVYVNSSLSRTQVILGDPFLNLNDKTFCETNHEGTDQGGGQLIPLHVFGITM